MQNRPSGSPIRAALGIIIPKDSNPAAPEATPLITPVAKPSLYVNTATPAVSAAAASYNLASKSPQYARLHSKPVTQSNTPCADAIILATPSPTPRA